MYGSGMCGMAWSVESTSYWDKVDAFTILFSLGKLWKPSEVWKGAFWKKQNNHCLVYLRNFRTSMQCWELLKLVGMSWNVASCMRIVVNRPWWNGLAPFGYWCMFVRLLFVLALDGFLWQGLCWVCNSWNLWNSYLSWYCIVLYWLAIAIGIWKTMLTRTCPIDKLEIP